MAHRNGRHITNKILQNKEGPQSSGVIIRTKIYQVYITVFMQSEFWSCLLCLPPVLVAFEGHWVKEPDPVRKYYFATPTLV